MRLTTRAHPSVCPGAGKAAAAALCCWAEVLSRPALAGARGSEREGPSAGLGRPFGPKWPLPFSGIS